MNFGIYLSTKITRRKLNDTRATWLYLHNTNSVNMQTASKEKTGQGRLFFNIFQGFNDIIDVNVCENLCNSKNQAKQSRFHKTQHTTKNERHPTKG